MSRVLFSGSGGNGVYSEDCTATANDILKGATAFFNGSDDDIGVGTLELTGDTTDGYVYNGKTYYNTDAHTKRTGTMTVGSILNFSAAVYSGRQVLLKWQNPYAATGKPFGGVFINYSTSGYPGTGGTRIYTGYGNNRASGGWSQAIVTLPNLNTTYYFSCTAYVNCSAGDVWGNTMNASCKTANTITKTITSSQNYTIPAGYNYVDIFCVGGGGGGGYGKYSGGTTSGYYVYPGGGGGGGYTATASNIAVSAGQVLNCAIGAGGTGGSKTGTYSYTDPTAGGVTKVTRNGSVLCSANGGNASGSKRGGKDGGGAGGSGGGNGEVCGRGTYTSEQTKRGGNGGTNGGAGYDGKNSQVGGSGQGRTTRPFGGGSGTVYSGGGAGGSGWGYISFAGGYGGNSGGGNGGCPIYVQKTGHDSDGYYTYNEFSYNQLAASGSANTGGGGGGGGVDPAPIASGIEKGANGGSGVIIIIVK